MADEGNLTDLLRVDPTDPMVAVAFSQPAVLADRFLVTERDGVIRISVAEESPDGSIHFRGAVVFSLVAAQELSNILGTIVKNARERNAGQ